MRGGEGVMGGGGDKVKTAMPGRATVFSASPCVRIVTTGRANLLRATVKIMVVSGFAILILILLILLFRAHRYWKWFKYLRWKWRAITSCSRSLPMRCDLRTTFGTALRRRAQVVPACHAQPMFRTMRSTILRPSPIKKAHNPEQS